MSVLVMFRHGQSVWNLENKFTGWVDVELSVKGVQEAIAAGNKLRNHHFDKAFTSALRRAQDTLWLALNAMGQSEMQIIKNEALNERMYGDLQGLNKSETEQKFGAEQVKIWRRSYDIPPPNGESLKNTAERVIPYFKKEIEPCLQAGQNVLVVAHGNSLRALIMHLEKMTPEQILEFEIGTAQPRKYVMGNELDIQSVQNL